jgi:hypothetical protein
LLPQEARHLEVLHFRRREGGRVGGNSEREYGQHDNCERVCLRSERASCTC